MEFIEVGGGAGEGQKTSKATDAQSSPKAAVEFVEVGGGTADEKKFVEEGVTSVGQRTEIGSIAVAGLMWTPFLLLVFSLLRSTICRRVSHRRSTWADN